MQRTYKSKKETAGVFDPRDVLLTRDGKSSVFDAFYIQNIKQTKRDMSVGCTMQFAASHKVRKRKRMKKQKEQDTICQKIQSSSRTALLTPNKSLRVNKAQDLFDKLLNSSCDKMEIPESLNLFTKLPVVQQKKYTKKQPNKKKINYSNSDSSDSDEENFNSSEVSYKTANTSDIKSHKLLIEKETKSNLKYMDESIDNIVNNLSIFSHLKNQVVTTPKNDKYNIAKHELSIQTSPLCSTPLLEKYRSASIYRFSPISTNQDNSSKCVAVIEENECATDESYTVNKETKYFNNYKIDKKQNISETTNRDNIKKIIAHKDNYETIKEKNTSAESIIYDSIDETCNKSEIQSPILSKRTVNDNKREPKKLPTYLSYVETTENEPFFGFEGIDLVVSNEPHTFHNKYKDIENILDNNSHTFVQSHTRLSQDSTFDNLNTIKDAKVISSECSNISLSGESSDSESYDTCNSNDNVEEQVQNIEPIVVVERLNDSVFDRYYSEMANYSVESNDLSISTDSNDNASVRASNSVSNNSSNYSVIFENSESFGEVDNNRSSGSEEIDNYNSNKSKIEEICDIFVTTRRRNEFHNYSFIGLDNSMISGNSYEFDKTVLTNKNSLENINYTTSEENIVDNSNDVLNMMENKDTKEISHNKTKIRLNRESGLISETKLATQIRKILTSENARESAEGEKFKLHINNTVPKINVDDSLNIVTRKSSRNNRDSVARVSHKSAEYEDNFGNDSISCEKPGIILQPGKKWERSLSIFRRFTTMTDYIDHTVLDEEQTKGRKYRQSVITTLEMQGLKGSFHNDSINSRRSTFVSKPSRSTIKIVRESNASRASLCSTIVCEDLEGFLGEDCDDTIVELSKLSIADSEHEVTIIEKFHDTSNRRTTARDYVLRRCNQTDVLPFDECYPDPVLKNCRKIGEGVYGEVFLWRAGDGRARVLKVIPIAGNIKVNGEQQKDFHEIISEIVIAMELSALRTPIEDIEQHLNEGKSLETLDLHSVENATDAFNEVLRVRCVSGRYPSRLLELWELYDECRGSENDSPASLPPQQQYIVLELGNAGQDLESYQFNNAEQSYALFKQIAFGLAVAEEAYQFEHRDLHWGNVLISPTEEKYASFVVRGRLHRVRRAGVRASVIDYSLSRATLGRCALYNDLSTDDALFDALGDYQFQLYRLMRDKLGNDWKNFEPYTNILWLHYTVDKMITALRYTRTNTKIHKHYIAKLKEIKNRILDYGSAVQYVLTDNEI